MLLLEPLLLLPLLSPRLSPRAGLGAARLAPLLVPGTLRPRCALAPRVLAFYALLGLLTPLPLAGLAKASILRPRNVSDTNLLNRRDGQFAEEMLQFVNDGILRVSLLLVGP